LLSSRNIGILSRWYDFEIFYQNAAVKDLHFTGNIPRHATINEVLKFLFSHRKGPVSGG